MATALSAQTARDARSYRKSHPWIDFQAPIDKLGHRFWMHMGSAESKCLHITRSPLKPDLARQLHQTAVTKGARATTAIEGNTLTEEQVAQAVRGELEVPPSQEYLEKEVENVIRLFNRLTKDLIDEEQPLKLTPEFLDDLNRELLVGTELRDGVVPGEIRDYSVTVGGVYRGAPAQDCPYLVECLCDWINGRELRPTGADADDPATKFSAAFLRATLAHLYMAWIHPYGDGNGRLSRLIEFAILIEAGVPLTAAHLLSHHYNQTRTRYYARLDESSRSLDGSGVAGFIAYSAQGFVDQLVEQLVEISRAVFATTWREYVYDTLPADTVAKRRQRKVALALPMDTADVADWPRRVDIRRMTPKLAELYFDKGPRTVARDINALAKRGVVVCAGDRAAANSSLLIRHMPSARDSDHTTIV
ncbi:Fic family protein [Patulibacter medicamentivorans]|uniref:Fic family protein n=1 Tax=Patulibacter medicamentivorans TaxID=1097667 RepID=UPI0006819AF0|nr:Fic family protein [Patulibacter medicamentivorans]